jgi:hypothetical protein
VTLCDGVVEVRFCSELVSAIRSFVSCNAGSIGTADILLPVMSELSIVGLQVL